MLFPKAVSSIAFDDQDGLYVLDEQQGVLRIDVDTEVQTTYAAPFFPFFVSPFGHPAPFLINDLAFDKDGYLYVTDSFQATTGTSQISVLNQSTRDWYREEHTEMSLTALRFCRVGRDPPLYLVRRAHPTGLETHRIRTVYQSCVRISYGLI